VVERTLINPFVQQCVFHVLLLIKTPIDERNDTILSGAHKLGVNHDDSVLQLVDVLAVSIVFCSCWRHYTGLDLCHGCV